MCKFNYVFINKFFIENYYFESNMLDILGDRDK